MAQSLAKILVHLVFSTKERQPFLTDPMARENTHRYLGGILARLDCQPITIGGVEDHVHLLFSFSRTEKFADVVKELKRASSLWVKSEFRELSDFAWQNGYGAFSLGFSQIDSVCSYIGNQEQRHRKISFQDEFRTLLRRYKIEFDERYVWD
jgi:REP element-mobilizing transposase RayT